MEPEKIEVIAPLFDRLVNQDPDQTEEAQVFKNYTLPQMRLAVERDVAHLLNTRYSDLPHSRRAFNSAMDQGDDLDDPGLMRYGLPDFSKYEVDKLSGQVAIEHDVAQLIAQYEPRLKDVEVYLNVSGPPRIEAVLFVSGVLVYDPSESRFTFPIGLQNVDLNYSYQKNAS